MSTEASAAPAAVESTAPVESTESAESTESMETEGEAVQTEQQAKKVEEIKKANKKKFNLKVNGRAKDIELDLDNDQELQKYLSKAMAADEKFEEAAMTRKQAEALVEMLKRDPLAVLRHPDLGIDIKKMAQDVLNAELEEMSMTPEQKRIAEMEKQLKMFEDEKKRLEDEKRQAELSKIETEAFQQLDDQISSALAKTSLPKSDYTIKRIADTMIDAINNGYTDVTVEQIMPIVEEKIQNEIRAMFDIAPDEVFERLVDKKRLDNYRKARVAKVKESPAAKVQDTGNTAKNAKVAEPKELRIRDLFKLT